ncbi:hypothetical protein [Streptomyces sp. NPDC001435]|uniref:hypothetical protein n=1 Tax=unclassified Streptomyces TaxID=2593676 RepID=UPI0036D165F6
MGIVRGDEVIPSPGPGQALRVGDVRGPRSPARRGRTCDHPLRRYTSRGYSPSAFPPRRDGGVTPRWSVP